MKGGCFRDATMSMLRTIRRGLPRGIHRRPKPEDVLRERDARRASATEDNGRGPARARTGDLPTRAYALSGGLRLPTPFPTSPPVARRGTRSGHSRSRGCESCLQSIDPRAKLLVGNARDVARHPVGVGAMPFKNVPDVR